MLTNHHKEECIGCCLHALLTCLATHFSCAQRPATKTWCHHFKPNSKHTMETFRITKNKKFRSQASASKDMLTAFFYHEGLLFADFKKEMMRTSMQAATRTQWTSCKEPLQKSDPALSRLVRFCLMTMLGCVLQPLGRMRQRKKKSGRFCSTI